MYPHDKGYPSASMGSWQGLRANKFNVSTGTLALTAVSSLTPMTWPCAARNDERELARPQPCQ